MISVVPILIIVIMVYGKYIRVLSKGYQDALAGAANTGNESISNARIMRSFYAEALEIKHYSAAVDIAYKKGASKALGYGVFLGGSTLLAGVTILIVIYYGARLVINKEMKVGELTSFMLYTAYIALGLATLSSVYTDLMNAIGASER